jgi:hypothetical protein
MVSLGGNGSHGIIIFGNDIAEPAYHVSLRLRNL